MTKLPSFFRLNCFSVGVLLSAFQIATSAQTSTGAHAYETEKFAWRLSTSHYYLDKGTTQLVTLEDGNWMKDAQGNEVISWRGAGNLWGWGDQPKDGELHLARLPKTMHISYYDYQEDRFYELDAELPQEKAYELFNQKTIDRSVRLGQIIPRYDGFVIGIAPQGHIVVWVQSDDGKDQVELITFKAQPIPDMTVERYNTTGLHSSSGRPAFPISVDRWKELSGPHALKPETIAKLKTGWTPSADHYLQQRIKYPWRYRLSGNGSLMEFTEIQGNQEHFCITPWMLARYQSSGAMRGVPSATVIWFNDSRGARHRVFMPFYEQDRVAGEPDLTPIWRAYEKLFPDRKVEDNGILPDEKEMATLDIHVSDDLKNFTATLIRGEQRVSLPIGKIQLFDLAPATYWPGQTMPSPEVVKRLQGGPDAFAPLPSTPEKTEDTSKSLGTIVSSLDSNGRFSAVFVLRDQHKKPISRLPYKITLEDGSVIRGITNEKGETKRVYTDDKPMKMRMSIDNED